MAKSKTGMRWFTIPKTQKLIKQVVDARTGEVVKDLEPEDYDYFEFLEDNVWPVKFWRESKENAETQERLQDLFDEARAESKSSIHKPIVVKMSEEDYQKFMPIASMQNDPRTERLGGVNGRAMTRHAQAILFATSKAPKSEEDKEADEGESESKDETGT